jgi:hypothetical protein
MNPNITTPLFLFLLVLFIWLLLQRFRILETSISRMVEIIGKRKSYRFVTFTFPSLKTKGVFMDLKLKKSQFQDDGAGNLVLHAHIEAKTEDGSVEKVEAGSVVYDSSNKEVATVEKSTEDESKMVITWIGPGVTQITASADANLNPGEQALISGVATLEVLPDEATRLDIVFDSLPA